MKKAKIIFVILAAFFMTSCGGPRKSRHFSTNGNGYFIQHVPNKTATYGFVNLEYKDHKFITAKELKSLKNRRASAAEIEKALTVLPKGGAFYIFIERLTIDAANTRWFEYIIEQDGKEIYRSKGKPKVPNTPLNTALDRTWWNTDVIALRKKYELPLTLYVIDNINDDRDVFVISDKSSEIKEKK